MLHKTGLVLAFSVASVLAALHQGPTAEVLNKDYDFVVVGAGAGGGVMASRLTEDPLTRVLLIEAGGSDFENLNISVPGRSSTLPMSAFDWNFTTMAQPGLNNRPVGYPRGFVLGGSTALNQMVFSRGTKDDYDRWANVTGDDGWSFKNLLPFIFAVDRMTAPVDHHNTIGQFNPAIHKNGVVPISVEGFPLEINSRVIDTTRELAEQFPFNLDYNSGNTIGFGWTQNTIHDGHRVTSASSYLAQAINRPNLDVVVNTRVTKVVSVGREQGKPVFRGVEIAQSADGPVHTLKAKKEVILSAGSLKTPHILMLSGIGDAAHLTALGIKPVVNLPAVGQNLQDHVFLGNSWVANSTNTLDDLHRNSTLAAEALALWKINGTGPLGLGAASQFGWLRVPNATGFFRSLGVEDPSAGETSAHFEQIPTNAFVSKTVPLPAEGHFFSIITAVVSPTARGNVTLNSTNPFDAPLINPNLLGSPVDVAIMREAVKAARAFVTAPTWSDYIVSEFGVFANATTDDELEVYIRKNSDTVDHPVGTVAMGQGTNAPLDSQLRVKGTVGLRVVDASAFPFIPSGHTQGPTYILAERAAHLVRSSL
ncbi:alcohol oxidase [Dichomitus squalens LYAD-421 SS1]|uniref:alcohol oxidase n=1 Tax=Dichomitus squalens (strain LYAD-421) TaxID=732165 RepID=UPI00044152A7|nr:alcohol oxidase [Dichomitus squalens LYAD-421 SS1]EJF63363.1 alcohol oxidase [Dichomitus squalens LYAD-421 SS1]